MAPLQRTVAGMVGISWIPAKDLNLSSPKRRHAHGVGRLIRQKPWLHRPLTIEHSENYKALPLP